MVEIVEESPIPDEEYIPNVWPALEILRKENKKIDEAIKDLENNRIDEAIRKLNEAGLEEDVIAYIVATVLRISIEDIIDEVYEVTSQVKKEAGIKHKEYRIRIGEKAIKTTQERLSYIRGFIYVHEPLLLSENPLLSFRIKYGSAS